MTSRGHTRYLDAMLISDNHPISFPLVFLGKVLGDDDCVRLRIFEKEKALPQFEGMAIVQCAKIILHQSLHKFRL
jgi:hypothetical protein